MVGIFYYMKNYVERDLEKEINKYLKSEEILAIIGPRRCGKTTICEKIIEDYKGKVNKITFEDVKTLRFFEEDIDFFIEEEIKGYDLIFIDEVQYSKDSGKKLKYIYDTCKIKIIISGSSAAEISIQSLKYLTGRILLFNLYPFSFGEFIRAKEKSLEKYLKNRKISSVILERLNNYLEEYLLYGGYPRVVLSKTKEEKKKILSGIFNTYLMKEIKEILDLSDDYHLLDLMKALSLQVGNIVNYEEISVVSGFKYLKLKKYLNILEKTFILKQVKPYFTNKRTEIVKSPKIYFFDFGFRNIILNNFETERTDKGSVYENFIFNQFIFSGKELKYWNTKSNAEVDFVFESGGKLIPIEIKSFLKEEKITKSFRSFIDKYPVKEGYFFSKDFLGERKFGGVLIEFLPFVLHSRLI